MSHVTQAGITFGSFFASLLRSAADHRNEVFADIARDRALAAAKQAANSQPGTSTRPTPPFAWTLNALPDRLLWTYKDATTPDNEAHFPAGMVFHTTIGTPTASATPWRAAVLFKESDGSTSLQQEAFATVEEARQYVVEHVHLAAHKPATA